MSSTGRGPRLGGPDDFYETPEWAVARLLERAILPVDRWPNDCSWLEPAAGNGAIIRAVDNYLGRAQPWVAVESRATCYKELASDKVDAFSADFLTWQPTPAMVEAISYVITNPPFNAAEEFTRRAFELFPSAHRFFLMRLGFLASETRLKLWSDIGVPSVYVLPNRPSFVASGKTDSADYCWLHWSPSTRGRADFDVLMSTPREVRRPRKTPKRRGAARG